MALHVKFGAQNLDAGCDDGWSISVFGRCSKRIPSKENSQKDLLLDHDGKKLSPLESDEWIKFGISAGE